MKDFLKRTLTFAAAFVFAATLGAVNVSAAQWKKAEVYTAFEQVVDEQRETQSTFAAGDILYGEALPDTCITITISSETSETVYSTKVGASCIFNLPFSLEEGKNDITVEAEYDGQTQELCSVQVTRLSQEVKDKLEHIIVFPMALFVAR